MVAWLVVFPIVTFTEFPPSPAGVSHVIVVSSTTIRFAAGIPSNVTASGARGSKVKPLPVRVTGVPPASRPWSGLTAVSSSWM